MIRLTGGDFHDVLRERSESCELESIVSFDGGSFEYSATRRRGGVSFGERRGREKGRRTCS